MEKIRDLEWWYGGGEWGRGRRHILARSTPGRGGVEHNLRETDLPPATERRMLAEFKRHWPACASGLADWPGRRGRSPTPSSR